MFWSFVSGSDTKVQVVRDIAPNLARHWHMTERFAGARERYRPDTPTRTMTQQGGMSNFLRNACREVFALIESPVVITTAYIRFDGDSTWVPLGALIRDILADDDDEPWPVLAYEISLARSDWYYGVNYLVPYVLLLDLLDLARRQATV